MATTLHCLYMFVPTEGPSAPLPVTLRDWWLGLSDNCVGVFLCVKVNNCINTERRQFCGFSLWMIQCLPFALQVSSNLDFATH